MTVPPPQVPYGPPSSGGDNPYAAANPYAAGPATAPAPAAPAPGGYGHPAGPVPDPYGAAVPGPMPAPAPGGAPYGYPQAPTGGPVCRFCGGFPAVEATVRGHQGLIIIMRFLKQPGPFCRTCGTATLRKMSADTLVRGWWSYLSGIFTLVTLVQNLVVHNKLKQLPPPAPGTHGPQPDPGVPLTKRPHIFMLLLPVLSITSFVVLGATGALNSRNHDPYPYDNPLAVPAPTFPAPSFSMPSFSIPPVPEFTATAPPKPSSAPSRVPSDVERAKAGDCLRNENQSGTTTTTDPNPRITMLDCSDPRAQYKVVAKVPGATDGESACTKYPTAESWFRRDGGTTASSFVLCLAPVNGKVPSS